MIPLQSVLGPPPGRPFSLQLEFGDARALPVQTDVVDIVVFVATLALISTVETIFDEAIRVLETEGTFVALVLNTRSAYVLPSLQRAGSYFQRMVHRDPDELAARMRDDIDGTNEHVLGIDGETVVRSTDPTVAADRCCGGARVTVTTTLTTAFHDSIDG